MNFQVRKSHALLLGLVGILQIIYLVYYLIPEYLIFLNDSRKDANTPDDKAVVTNSIFDPGYIITNENLCVGEGQNLLILIITTSAPANFEARMAIRQTWGSFKQRKYVAMSFLIGSVQDNKTNQALASESNTYGDIIMAQFLDTYENLTLKTLSMLEWVDTYCNKIKFVLKTDDDVFINIPTLLSFVSKHSKDKRTIFGRLARRWKPFQDKKHKKYYVSQSQYLASEFPDFTTGPAYLLTGDVVHDLYTTALNKTYLKLEDMFITGIVAQDRKVRRSHAKEFVNEPIPFNRYVVPQVISIHQVKYREQFDLRKKLSDGNSDCVECTCKYNSSYNDKFSVTCFSLCIAIYCIYFHFISFG